MAPGGSYASVVAGQPRLSGFSSEINHNGTGVHTRLLPNPNLSGLNGYTSSQQQKIVRQPITVPSYLAESSYAERLASRAAVFNPLPTPSPCLTLPGKVPQAHRGLTFDIIENAPGDDEALTPLPTRWNEKDKCQVIELLGYGSEVKFVGSSAARRRSC